MSEKFTKTHEWVRVEGDIAVIGITDYAQEQLGNVVFVEVPETGRQIARGDDVAVVESVKAASEIYAPLSGEIIEGNAALEDKPELVNEACDGDGWFFKIRLSDIGELDDLLDVAAYETYIKELG